MISEAVEARCRACIGKTRELRDSLSPEPAERLAALTGRDLAKELPLCWHWAYFNPAIPPENVGHDGHERLGVFLPDVPLPRRMWAAGEIDVRQPLRLGEAAVRTSLIEDVSFKTGRTGPLCFVTLRHDIVQVGQHAMTERQTIVYRDRGTPDANAQNVPPEAEGFASVPDTTLIAYSAITQNGHRIHWDREFCRTVEGYPGLVVHGPWLATMLAGALSPNPEPVSFAYRAKAPVFENIPIRIARSEPDRAKILRSDGVTAMTAELGS